VRTSTEPEFAISLYAPWAWALMHAGKDVENRGLTFPKTVTGRVWVHASLWPHLGAESRLAELYLEFSSVYECMRQSGALQGAPHVSTSQLDALRGHIVGSIEVTGYRRPEHAPESPWYVPESLAVLVREPRPLARTVPAKGARGWWRPSAEVLTELRL